MEGREKEEEVRRKKRRKEGIKNGRDGYRKEERQKSKIFKVNVSSYPHIHRIPLKSLLLLYNIQEKEPEQDSGGASP